MLDSYHPDYIFPYKIPEKGENYRQLDHIVNRIRRRD